MGNETCETELLGWLKNKPELLAKLEQLRELEESDSDLNQIELELLELVKELGADSFKRALAEQSKQAVESALKEKGKRVHGKKN